MRTRVVVYTVTDYEVTLESNTLEEALEEAKFQALTNGDYSSQKAEWEVLDEIIDKMALQVVREERKPRKKYPYIAPSKRPGTWLK